VSRSLRGAPFAPKCGDRNTCKDCMTDSTLWWLLAGAAIGVELATGTFYLLMLAMGLAVAALSAHLGASFTLQIVIAAIASVCSVFGWHFYKKTQPANLPAHANRDVNMDIGETVQVDAWNTDGTGMVKYRGANWAISCVSGGPFSTGPHQVVEVVGSRLIVRKL
jgi:membrane protein implicated in regulation of membrane protease activity